MPKYGICAECGVELEAVWCQEQEYVDFAGIQYPTGKVRRAVDYLECPCCLKKNCVDDSFDGPWREK